MSHQMVDIQVEWIKRPDFDVTPEVEYTEKF